MDDQIVQIGEDFQSQVHAALNNAAEEEKVFATLREYSSSKDVEVLVRSLRVHLADPGRLHLFEAVRPFVAIKHQQKYDRICPTVPGRRLKTIRLMRQGIEDLGFSFRGGLDLGTGIFVSRVEPKSRAEREGLMPGDEIVRINGYDLSEALHMEVLLLLKMRNQTLELKVRRMGLLPNRTSTGADVTWFFVEANKTEAEEKLERVASDLEHLHVAAENDRKVYVSLKPGSKLGCGIGNNAEWGKGIFVCRVNPGGIAETLGFVVGDQVMEVNGNSYVDISHEDAVMNLKTSRHLTVILRSRKFEPAPMVATEKPASKIQATPAAPPANQKVTTAEVNPVPAAVKADPTPKPKEEPKWWTMDPKTLFTLEQIDGRELKRVNIKMDGPLNMFLEGGNKTPLGGKIVVSDLYPDGSAYRCNKLKKGDQILMCEGVILVDVSLEKAEDVFKEQMSGPMDGSKDLRLIIASTPPRDYEDEITFF